MASETEVAKSGGDINDSGCEEELTLEHRVLSLQKARGWGIVPDGTITWHAGSDKPSHHS